VSTSVNLKVEGTASHSYRSLFQRGVLDALGGTSIPAVQTSWVELGLSRSGEYTTLGSRMKCGVGKCGRCNVGSQYVCKDGPVFSCSDLQALPAEF